MPSIGGITVITIKGGLTPPGESVEEITRPGHDGHAYKRFGERAPRAELTSIRDVDAVAGVAAHILACVALKGTLITVIDDVGVTMNNVMVIEVETVRSREVGTPVGGVTAGNHLIAMRWLMQMTT